ncbi:hypothetical protein [Gottfriedia luciferensis]|uniref:hypothetical protein n=1 Tax=Gottfriedia luciferensis TaxID=178774 RepID=UPI000B44C073|nr:hypothetical protein [Gottfriedia luciferensis]
MNIQVYIHHPVRLFLNDQHKNIRLSVDSHKKLFKAFGLNPNLYKEHIVYENSNGMSSYILLAGAEDSLENQEKLSLKSEDKINESDDFQQKNFINDDLLKKRSHDKTFFIEEFGFNEGHYIYRITEVD